METGLCAHPGRVPDGGYGVRLGIYDTAGRLVRRLCDGEVRNPGRHVIRWDGRDVTGLPLPSGVYVCRIEAGDARDAGKMVLIR